MDVINDIQRSLPKSLHELGYKVDNVEMSPVFNVVHYVLVVLSIRSHAGALEYARHHPFPSWFVSVTTCFGGKIIQNFLFGLPIIEVYLNLNNVALASIVWYLLFFAPMDVVADLCNIRIIKVVILALKEVHRLRGIKDGVVVASRLYSGNWFVAIFIGCVRGSGAKFLGRPLYQFIQGTLSSENEFFRPAFSTKQSVVTALLLVLRMNGMININENLLIAIIFLVTASVQVLIYLSKMDDPYIRIEEICCKILLALPSDLLKKDSKKKAD